MTIAGRAATPVDVDRRHFIEYPERVPRRRRDAAADRSSQVFAGGDYWVQRRRAASRSPDEAMADQIRATVAARRRRAAARARRRQARRPRLPTSSTTAARCRRIECRAPACRRSRCSSIPTTDLIVARALRRLPAAAGCDAVEENFSRLPQRRRHPGRVQHRRPGGTACRSLERDACAASLQRAARRRRSFTRAELASLPSGSATSSEP